MRDGREEGEGEESGKHEGCVTGIWNKTSRFVFVPDE